MRLAILVTSVICLVLVAYVKLMNAASNPANFENGRSQPAIDVSDLSHESADIQHN